MYYSFVATAIVAFTIAFTPIASAADWSGWYAGVNAGGIQDDHAVKSTASNNRFCAPPSCGFGQETAQASVQGATGKFSLKTDGFTGNAQIGYNWLFANNWIAGFEADIDGNADTNASQTGSSVNAVSGFAGHGVSTNLSVTKKINFLGTLRGRLGYRVTPKFFIFGTGGLAYAHVKSKSNITQSLVGVFGGVATNFAAVSSSSRILPGWTTGGGFEWMFAKNWTAKAEYLYYDLGELSYDSQLADPITVVAPPTPFYFVNDVNTRTSFKGDILQVGLVYHF